jgi:hypothetical protein
MKALWEYSKGLRESEVVGSKVNKSAVGAVQVAQRIGGMFHRSM